MTKVWSVNKGLDMAKKAKKLTDESLRQMLWETTQAVFDGTMESRQGDVVAKSAREILNIEKTKVMAHKAGLLVNGRKLLG